MNPQVQQQQQQQPHSQLIKKNSSSNLSINSNLHLFGGAANSKK